MDHMIFTTKEVEDVHICMEVPKDNIEVVMAGILGGEVTTRL